jgi:hypothetical protein
MKNTIYNIVQVYAYCLLGLCVFSIGVGIVKTFTL